ncbi:MAG TPA: hypothetical protein VGZ73_29930 [Bryobacteraceae bacterium]|jgi:hypothetical protein|nr:hypothetical protein [Bryobacteraceae bacterium]
MPAADFQNDTLYFLAFAGMGLKKLEYVALFQGPATQPPASAALQLNSHRQS